MEDALIDWDDPDDPLGNTAHIAEHGLSPEEVESVLRSPDAIEDSSDSSGRTILTGYALTGRRVCVAYDVLNPVDPLVIRPVTAFEPDDPLA
jgi:uncharacterized DUF497 family protein